MRAWLTAIAAALLLLISACSSGEDAPSGSQVGASTVTGSSSPKASGSSSPKASGSSSPSAQSAPPSPDASLAALAAGINLRQSDLPGYVIDIDDSDDSDDSDGEDPGTEAAKARFFSCVGLGSDDGEDDPSVESPTFDSARRPPFRSWHSEVEFSEPVTDAELAILATPRTVRCFEDFLQQSFQATLGDEAQIGNVQASLTDVDPGPAEAAFGIRATADLTVEGVRLPLTFDLTFLFDGPTQVSLFGLAFGENLPPGQRGELLRVLAQRLAGDAAAGPAPGGDLGGVRPA